jgi:xanthine/uracil permease
MARTSSATATADRHPVDEMLPVGQPLLYGLQHVMSMYAGVIAVPLIVGTALGLPFPDLAYLLTAALLVSGLTTLLQTIGVWRVTPEYDVPGGSTAPDSPADTVQDTDGQGSITRSGGSAHHPH